MVHLKIYNLIRILSTISLMAIVYQYWSSDWLGIAFMLIPYVIIFLLANKNAYQTKLKLFCRAIGGVLVLILAIGLLLGVESDPQTGVGIGFAVIIQYFVIFISEAIIGFATYKEDSA